MKTLYFETNTKKSASFRKGIALVVMLGLLPGLCTGCKTQTAERTTWEERNYTAVELADVDR